MDKLNNLQISIKKRIKLRKKIKSEINYLNDICCDISIKLEQSYNLSIINLLNYTNSITSLNDIIKKIDNITSNLKLSYLSINNSFKIALRISEEKLNAEINKLKWINFVYKKHLKSLVIHHNKFCGCDSCDLLKKKCKLTINGVT